jgi:MerR family transcriptional regulator, copper efflux regulator
MAEMIEISVRDARPGAPTRPDGAGLTIGQVSQRTGIAAKTIRYYESIGLLPEPARGANAYRRYSLGDVNRLLLLRRIKLLGAPLAGAKDLLEGVTDARCADAQEALLALVDSRLSALDQQIAELRTLREQVSDYRRALAACRADDDIAFADCSDMRCIGASPDQDGALCALSDDTGTAPSCPDA